MTPAAKRLARLIELSRNLQRIEVDLREVRAEVNEELREARDAAMQEQSKPELVGAHRG